MIALVVFDLGRVLIRICNNYREACALAGIQVPHDRPYADDDPATAARDHDAIVQLDTGRIDLTEFAHRVSVTRGIPPEHVIRAYDIFLLEPYPGAVELIDDLHAAGLRTACLSNTSDGHWRQMNDPSHSSFFPLDRLTWRFASHLIGACKPADAIYEHVERTTELPPWCRRRASCFSMTWKTTWPPRASGAGMRSSSDSTPTPLPRPARTCVLRTSWADVSDRGGLNTRQRKLIAIPAMTNERRLPRRRFRIGHFRTFPDIHSVRHRWIVKERVR